MKRCMPSFERKLRGTPPEGPSRVTDSASPVGLGRSAGERELRYSEYEPWLLGWCRWRLELRLVSSGGGALTQTVADGKWKWRGRDARLHEHVFVVEKSESFGYDPASAEMYPINGGMLGP